MTIRLQQIIPSRLWIFAAFIFLLSESANATFSYLLTNTSAAQQPTAIGKYIHTIKGHDGKVYMGYGDFLPNTGPINVCSFQPPSSSVTCEFLLSSEEINNFRIHGGQLYVPSIDPTVPGNHAYAKKSSAGSWSSKSRFIFPGSLVHVFDFDSFAGSLWAIGSEADRDATVWRSTNGGSSWTISLEVPNPPPNACCGRFYDSAVYNNRLYVQSYHGSSTNTQSRFFDGSSWNVGQDLLIYGSPQRWGYRMKAFKSYLLTLQSGIPVVFDGVTSHTAGGVALEDYEVHGNWVYGIRKNTGEVWRRSDFSTNGAWSLFESGAPSNSVSIAVLDGIVYVGTKDSKIYKGNTQISGAGGSIVPPIYLLILDD